MNSNFVHSISKTKEVLFTIPQTVLTLCRCADRVARVSSCVGRSQTAKFGSLGEAQQLQNFERIGRELVDQCLHCIRP